MQCAKCNKEVEAVNEHFICQGCEFQAIVTIVEAERPTLTTEQMFEALRTAETIEEIHGVFMKGTPPTDPMEQAKVREQMVRALKKKQLSSPAKLVDAWMNAAESEEEATQHQASMLVELVLKRDAQLFHTTDQQAFAAVSVDAHREVLALKSRGFRLWLGREYYEATAPEKPNEDGSLAAFFNAGAARVPRAQAVVEALGTLEGMAIFDGPELPVYVRVAHVGDLVYLDLGNEEWSAIEISRTGWTVVATPPVMFRRPSGLGELPMPVTGGSIEELRQFMNVQDAEWPLVAGVILGLFSPGPYVVTVVMGEQGSGKSTAARVIRAVVDPNTAPLRRKPRSDHDLAIAANNSWVLNFDNLSTLPQWLSDAVCTLATGGGFSTRMLYSDDEERLFDSKRPVIMNGIGSIATSSDLLDRGVLLTFLPIEDKLPEEEFWPEFYEALPRVLGAVLDGVVAALASSTTIAVEASVRMVDFARWAMAGLPAVGLEAAPFLEAYAANQRDADLLALEASPIGKLVREFAATKVTWEGTASDLLHELERLADDDDGVDPSRDMPGQTRRSKAWPQAPDKLSHELRRMAPNLRRVGVDVQFNRSGSARTIAIAVIVPPPEKFQGLQTGVTSVTGVTPGTGEGPNDANDADDGEMHTLESLLGDEHPEDPAAEFIRDWNDQVYGRATPEEEER